MCDNDLYNFTASAYQSDCYVCVMVKELKAEWGQTHRLAGGRGVKGEVMRVLVLWFRPWEWRCYVMTHAHSRLSESCSRGQPLTGEVGWTLRLLPGHLKCLCHQHSVACITVSATLGTGGNT